MGLHLNRFWTVVVASVAFIAVTVLRFAAGDDQAEPYLVLYVLPIGLVAAAFGVRGGLVAAGIALGLYMAWITVQGLSLSFSNLLVRVLVFGTVGLGFGLLRHLLDNEVARGDRWFGMSNDMLAEADFEGRFTRVNDEWSTNLGYTSQDMTSLEYIELVHPDDREATIKVVSGLSRGDSSHVGLENRYLAKDGSWRWLRWSSKSDSQRIYSMARDVTDSRRRRDEREELLTRAESDARTDPVSGLPNRRYWDEETHRAYMKARQEGGSFGIAMLDIDGFKAFNDAHGHAAGDALLRQASRFWLLALRKSDLLARLGGDEFAVLLPGCPLNSALAIVERLRAATPQDQTCSVGLVIWDGRESVKDLEHRADQALYSAKEQGRDRTVVG